MVEVKLQRNALSVLKPPTGLEEDGNDSEDGRSNIEEHRQLSKQGFNRKSLVVLLENGKLLMPSQLLDPNLAIGF